jgi:hypothetical protein
MKEETEGLKPLKEYGASLDSVLKDLCEAVGADYYTMDFAENDWYFKHTWTMQDQLNFKNKLVKKIKNNKKFYSNIISVKSDKDINTGVEMFLFTYGWKFKENQEN